MEKRIILKSILIGGILILALSSCKKTWTCDCDASGINVVGGVVNYEKNLAIEGNRIYDAKAKEQCENFKTSISNDSVVYSCKLKR
jgi:hypothetical protein